VLDSLKNQLDVLGYDALVHISPMDQETSSVSVTAYSTSPMSVDMKEAIGSRVDEAVEDYRLSLYEIDDLKQIMEDVKYNSTVVTYTLGEDGEENLITIDDDDEFDNIADYFDDMLSDEADYDVNNDDED
jgi:hypothetical protein